MPTLIFSPRANDTAQVLAVAAHRRALRTESLTSWAVPDHLRGLRDVHLYASPLFGDAVAADLDLALLEPADRWLVTLTSSSS
jgi:hypothetical protein